MVLEAEFGDDVHGHKFLHEEFGGVGDGDLDDCVGDGAASAAVELLCDVDLRH